MIILYSIVLGRCCLITCLSRSVDYFLYMIKKCCICNEDFLLKTWNQITCSKQCAKERWKVVEKERLQDPEYRRIFYEKKKISALKDYEKHRERCLLDAKKLRYTKNCKECWKEFKAYSKTLLLCSKECQSIWLKRDRIWENNPAFRNWSYTKESNKLDHKKWDYKFQKMCKEMNEEMVEKYWYRFCECCWINQSLRWEHHHIVFRSEKPWHEFLHNKLNTIHLCIKCHNEFHKNKSKRDPLMQERWLDKIFWITI